MTGMGITSWKMESKPAVTPACQHGASIPECQSCHSSFQSTQPQSLGGGVTDARRAGEPTESTRPGESCETTPVPGIVLHPLDKTRFLKASALVAREALRAIRSAEIAAIADGDAHRLLGPAAKLVRAQKIRRLARQTVLRKMREQASR